MASGWWLMVGYVHLAQTEAEHWCEWHRGVAAPALRAAVERRRPFRLLAPGRRRCRLRRREPALEVLAQILDVLQAH